MNYLLHTLTNPWTAITTMCVFLTAFLVKGLPPIKQYLDLRKAMLDIEKTKLELEKLKKDNKDASKRVVAATFADVEKFAMPKLKDPNLLTYSTLEMPSPAQGINLEKVIKSLRPSLFWPIVLLILLLCSIFFSSHYVWKWI